MQMIESMKALPRKDVHLDADGDGVGTLAFIHDLDGDLSTPDTLGVGESHRYALYFTTTRRSQGTILPAVWPTDIVTTNAGIQNATATAVIDGARGGMLDAFTWNGSPVLTSQAGSCCGNGMYMYFPPGWLDPQDEVADLVEVLADGPIVGAVRSSGTRTVLENGIPVGAYTYDAVYWLVTGRRELYYSTTQRTLIDTISQHPDEVVDGFRPWESRQQQLAATGQLSYQQDIGQGWASVTAPAWGIAFALSHPPTYLTELANPLLRANGQPFVDYFAVLGNDWLPGPLGTPYTVPADTLYYNSVDFVIWPYAGQLAGTRDEMLEVTGFVDNATGAAERTRR
jgi:hypothetical protein